MKTNQKILFALALSALVTSCTSNSRGRYEINENGAVLDTKSGIVYWMYEGKMKKFDIENETLQTIELKK